MVGSWAVSDMPRRRKTEWQQRASSEVFEWQGYRAGFLLGSWAALRFDGWIDLGLFASKELAQAACEDHFWAELERDVVERVN